MEINSKMVATNLLWRFFERIGAQGVSFIVSIILARIIAPEEYGTIALMTVFISIFNVFIDSGMGAALVQKKDADELDYSTVFTFNMVMCIFLYLILFFTAPYVAKFYNDMSMVWPLRVLGFTIIISGFKGIQVSYVSKKLLFKKFFFSTLLGTIGAALAGIFLAYKGFGIWALVAQHVFNTLVDTIVLFITVKWRPSVNFSFARFKGLFSYGWKILVSSLINTVYMDIRQLIIGRKYTSSSLAYYNRGKTFPNMFVTNINATIDSVLLPVMSTVQDKKMSLKAMTRRSICTSSYIMWPLMMGMAAVAEPMIRLMLTDKWLGSVPYLRIFCITYAFMPIHTANLNAIKSIGRSDIFLKMEIAKKTVGIIVLVITIPMGVMAMAYSLLFTTVISGFINAMPNKKFIGYGYFEQIKDILPSILMSVLMLASVYCIGIIVHNEILALVIQIVSGMVVYIGLSALFKIESFIYLFDILKNIKKRK